MVVMLTAICLLLAGLIFIVLWAAGETWQFRHHRLTERLLTVGRWLMVLAVLGVGLSVLAALTGLSYGTHQP